MKELSKEVVDTVVRRLVQSLNPERILLFGSHVWGTPNADSDVDLLVIVADAELPAYKRARAGHRALRGVRVPKDIMVLTQAEFDRQSTVTCSLAHRVREHGRILYDRCQAPRSRAVVAQEPA
jgi:predicted nucleotidyltransferase